MKFLLTGDWHMDYNRPEKRVDDYWETAQRKIEFILKLAKKESCDLILQPGDFFNSHKANDFLKSWTIKKLNEYSFERDQIMVATVFGQHDLRYHSSDVSNTPLSVLDAAGKIHIANAEPLINQSCHIYGASWYEEIPKIIHEREKYSINILITHRMIIKNEKLWEGQEDAEMGNILLKTSGYDLIVSGDNHQHFTISTRAGKHLVNCGSLLRSKIDQVDHHPTVYIYDTKDLSITPHEVPHEPFDKVFDLSKYEEEKERDEKLEAFVERMTNEVELEGLDFVKNMNEFVAQQELDNTTLDIIGEVMK